MAYLLCNLATEDNERTKSAIHQNRYNKNSFSFYPEFRNTRADKQNVY